MRCFIERKHNNFCVDSCMKYLKMPSLNVILEYIIYIMFYMKSIADKQNKHAYIYILQMIQINDNTQPIKVWEQWCPEKRQRNKFGP